MEQWHKDDDLHVGHDKLFNSLKERFLISKLKYIVANISRHCKVYQAQTPPNDKEPGKAEFYPILELLFESFRLDLFSMPPCKMSDKKSGKIISFDTTLMCVCRHSGYIVACSATNEGLTGHEAAQILYRSQSTIVGPPQELISDKRSAVVSSWFKTFCHLQWARKAFVAYQGAIDMLNKQTDKSSTS